MRKLNGGELIEVSLKSGKVYANIDDFFDEVRSILPEMTNIHVRVKHKDDPHGGFIYGDIIFTGKPGASPRRWLTNEDFEDIERSYTGTREDFEAIIAEDTDILHLGRMHGFSDTDVRERIGRASEKLGIEVSN